MTLFEARFVDAERKANEASIKEEVPVGPHKASRMDQPMWPSPSRRLLQFLHAYAGHSWSVYGRGISRPSQIE
jgi:hypothetical protein